MGRAHAKTPPDAPEILYSTLSSDSVKRLIAPHYRLARAAQWALYHRGETDTYRVMASDRSFAVRLYPTQRCREAIAAELAALAYAQSHGAAVAQPLPRCDGALITELRAPEGLRQAVVFEWVEGQIPSYTNAQDAERFGAALAGLHRACERLPVDAARPWMDLERLFAQPLERVRARAVGLPRLEARLQAVAERIQRHVERAQPLLDDWGFCHGDVWAENARIDGDRVVLLDFDLCGWGWHIADLAGYKFYLVERGVQHGAWDAFVAGYLGARPAAAAQLPLIGLFTIFYRMVSAAHIIARAPQAGVGSIGMEFLERVITYCERLEPQIGASAAGG